MAFQDTSVHLQIAHVLFLDVVGYSKLLVNEQREVVSELTEAVRATAQFRRSDATKQLIRIPVGDGMALVFFQTPEEPVHCAMELARALQNHPRIELRMGINSGPIERVRDVNDQMNIAGVGINIAQRVMALGDAGHIIITRRVAADLAEDSSWQAHLHDLGEVELKHGLKVGIVNVYNDEVGNNRTPTKLQGRILPKDSSAVRARGGRLSSRLRIGVFILGALLIAVGFGYRAFYRTPSPAKSASPASSGEKSIAVLPFENLTSDSENAFFAEGVQDEILTDLAKIADLKVISRTSVMQYKTGATRNLREIAQALGVSHVVEGSVQRDHDRIRMRAQLIDARTDTHLWAEQYDRKLSDIFAIQSEIAQAVADQLQAKISAGEKAAIERPPTTDLGAYDLYVRAQALWGDSSDPYHGAESLSRAARLLSEAVQREPSFLLAWCLLAKTDGALYRQGYDYTPARLSYAKTAVEAALRLQPNAGEAHLAQATYYYYGLGDFESARRELEVAQRVLPNDPEIYQYRGFIDRRQGRWDQATRNLERALELDPRNLFLLQQLGLTYPSQRRYAEEAQIWNRQLTIIPGDPLTRVSLALIPFHEQADLQPYQQTLRAILAESPQVAPDIDSPFIVICERDPATAARALGHYPAAGTVDSGVLVPHAYWEGVIAKVRGDPVKAREAFTVARAEIAKIVETQPDFATSLSLLGVIDAGLARKEDALREGRRACELLPISKDALDGAALAVNLAQIYAWTGEKDLAIQQIAALERVPNLLSYGLLKLHPYWDSLRGDSRFENVVASLAPKPKSAIK